MMKLRAPSFWLGLALGGMAVVVALWLPYVNWRRVVDPVATASLVIRHDAKGDGQFGAPRSGNRRHRGVDLSAPLNTPVRAIRSGTVVEAGTHRGLGRFVQVKHQNKLRSLYAHLNEVTVQPGERVRQGEQIGTVGKTGNAKHPSVTPHLHLEVSKNGKSFDPQALGLRIVELPVGPEDTSYASGGE